MNDASLLGSFEELILLAILKMGGNAYGVTIKRELEAATNKSVAYGAVYVTLDRLERKGYLDSHEGEPTKERGGRAKRFYTVNGAGEDALRAHARALVEIEAARRQLRPAGAS